MEYQLEVSDELWPTPGYNILTDLYQAFDILSEEDIWDLRTFNWRHRGSWRSRSDEFFQEAALDY